ncbi:MULTISPECIES: transposase-like zinc-binding domain-containing protein [unclassified Citrobacter]|uniref:IS1/IS1595 family N-terminal zinc-binding domain-containing protein n=1 Tax=unclassified Citrobacter TaxID=2644389 RepID=UPI0023021202|nr:MULTISPECIES: cytoplasmic protein [unclassified Citrobacter]MDA8517917.1 cytoplasmic protein [Citrobacter sp. Igbk 16]MEB2418938.1 cytoplasmic protein [Citrobacter sp. R-1.5.2]
MFFQINVDACKTPECKNMGILNSPDYLVQGKDILCRECGFSFPVISERSLNLFRLSANLPWRGLIKACPGCGSSSLKKYGFSAQGEARLYCLQCHKTFVFLGRHKADVRQESLARLILEGASLADIRTTLSLDSTGLNRALQKLSRSVNQSEREFTFPAFDLAMSTRAFRVKFNGGDHSLYVLVTAEESSGRVIAVTTNYSTQAVEEEYQYISDYEERLPSGTLAHLVQRKELMTMRRNTLFDVDYGPAALHKNDPGMLVKPVLPAYRHFELVKELTDERTLNVQHYIDHECFILGGCMMANLKSIRQSRCHISFVREMGDLPSDANFPYRVFRSGGIRNNVWRSFSSRGYAKAVCNLTGNKKTSMLRYATLTGATKFIQFLQVHPFFLQLSRLSPANVTMVLNYLKFEYNKNITL